MKRILLLSAYHTASHKAWCDGLVEQLTDFDWTLLSLPDRYFRWRIRGNPLSWYQSEQLSQQYDLIVATSMVDLATIKGIHAHLAITPSIVYFHENQFAFPTSSQQHDSVDPQMVNLYSAMAANQLVFNSQWNLNSFISGVETLLAKLPDQTPDQLVESLKQKAQVLPVAISDDCLPVKAKMKRDETPLTLLWAARWEYDKGPERLLAALQLLELSGLDYRIHIVGQKFRQSPKAFKEIKQQFGHRIGAYGFQASRADYLKVLQSSDLFISTALHEFQGLSALEAVACGCIPVVPNRLSYPGLFDAKYCYPSHSGSHEKSINKEAQGLVANIQQWLGDVDTLKAPSVNGWQWSELRAKYITLFNGAMSSLD